MDNDSNLALTLDIDLNKSGKQCGYVHLPHSVQRSAYGWLPMPIVSIKNGDGPKVVISAGTHGDEYEGQLLVSKLIRTVKPEMINGQIILIPMTNFPAAQAGLRTSPIDGGNLNRMYPGKPDGSLTQVIAYFMENVILSGADYYLDLHSGGSSLMYLPSMLLSNCTNPENLKKGLELANAMALPYALCSDDNSPYFSDMAAFRQGAFPITTELGGAGMVTPYILKMAEDAIQRFLTHISFYKETWCLSAEPSKPHIMWVNQATHYVYASEAGLFEPLVELGDQVEAGQKAAHIHFVDTPDRSPITLTFKGNGLVVCKRVPAQSRRGDCLFHLASESNDNLAAHLTDPLHPNGVLT